MNKFYFAVAGLLALSSTASFAGYCTYNTTWMKPMQRYGISYNFCQNSKDVEVDANNLSECVTKAHAVVGTYSYEWTVVQSNFRYSENGELRVVGSAQKPKISDVVCSWSHPQPPHFNVVVH